MSIRGWIGIAMILLYWFGNLNLSEFWTVAYSIIGAALIISGYFKARSRRCG